MAHIKAIFHHLSQQNVCYCVLAVISVEGDNDIWSIEAAFKQEMNARQVDMFASFGFGLTIKLGYHYIRWGM